MIIKIVRDNNPSKVYTDIIERNGAPTAAERKAEFEKALNSAVNETTNSQNSSQNSNQSQVNNPSSVNSNTFSANQIKGATDAKPKLSEINSPTEVPANLLPIFEEAAKTYNVDAGLLIAMARQESNFRTDAVSSAGAIGVMQLMPKTAEGLGVTDPYDARQNIMGGAKLISGQLEKYNGNISLALAAYSAGGGAVKKYDGIPPYKETQNHIPRVLYYYSKGYKSADGGDIVLPNAEKLAEQVILYKNTKGSAFQDGVEMTDRQKEDLKKLLVVSSSYFY